jgi:hypothetical protein
MKKSHVYHKRRHNMKLAKKMIHDRGYGSYTPIQTIIELLIAPIAIHGGVDLFIYIPANRSITTSTPWNGLPWTYEPYEGDRRPCELYANNPIFHPSTGNKAFCLVEYESQLTDRFIARFPYWRDYFYEAPEGKEMFLQQEFGKYRGNLAAKQYALLSGHDYKYKVRLRPDEAIIKAIPPIQSFGYRRNHRCPGSTIYYPDEDIYGYSAVDSFNIGEASAMDMVLDRYMLLLTRNANWTMIPRYKDRWWTSELHLNHSLYNDYGICLKSHKQIVMAKIRKSNYSKPFAHPQRTSMDWIALESPP